MVSGLYVCFWCSLRAQFSCGSSSINQLHGSGSSDEAEREIGFFFPPEDTLAVIKPDAEHKGIISAVKTKEWRGILAVFELCGSISCF